jgi:hypothetical protein
MWTVSPGFPGGDANITRSAGWNTKSFPSVRLRARPHGYTG